MEDFSHAAEKSSDAPLTSALPSLLPLYGSSRLLINDLRCSQIREYFGPNRILDEYHPFYARQVAPLLREIMKTTYPDLLPTSRNSKLCDLTWGQEQKRQSLNWKWHFREGRWCM